MARKFQCLLWIALVSVSTCSCNHYFDYPSYDYPNYYHRSPNKAKEIVPNRRIDQFNYDQYQEDYYDRTDQGQGFKRKLQEWLERPNEEATRMSERSVPEHSGIQRVQEQERVRLESRVDDSGTRIENGSYKVVNYRSKPYPSVADRRVLLENNRSSIRDDVVFPGPTSKPSKLFVPKIPEECLKIGVCEDVPDYPEEKVATIVQKIGNTSDRFKVDELNVPEIAQRIGPPEETELCVFYEKIITPRAAPDKDGNWFFILNLKDKPLQGFRVEICERDKSPCSKLVYFYSGYEATCKQKFMLRYMTALDGNGQIIERPFKLPSCCSCVIRQIE